MSDIKNVTIYKFELNGASISSSKLVEMPVGAQVLTFNFQQGAPFIWCSVDADPNAPLETRHFTIVGTGWLLEEEPSKYIGTAYEGRCVWHCFELLRGSLNRRVPA